MALSLHYLVREPSIIKDKNPLILLLHGYGSNEQDLFSFAPELPSDCYVVSVRAPHSLQYGSYAWYAINFDADENKFSDHDQAIESRDAITAFIAELIAAYPIDATDITLLGFSQGTILSYAVALSNPGMVRRVVALSGYLNEDIISDGYAANDFGKLAMFVSHGASDQMIPVEWARKVPGILSKCGIPVEYKEYPVGHGVAAQNFHDLKDWLLRT